MKKRVAAVLCAVMMLLSLCAPLTASAAFSLPDDVDTTCTSAVVVFLGTDMADDMLLYEQNADAQLPPSGMVRVMVGLYALKLMDDRNIDPSIATGTFTESIFDTFAGTGLYTVGMNFGDVWTMEDLLSVAMIQTAADVAGTLATSLAGTHTQFVEGMNALAAEIGCQNTHFTNVYGLDQPGHYTSARDMYTILRYATFHYPEMITMLSRSEHGVKPVKGQEDFWPNTNEMLRANSPFYYEPLVYGRSGFTESIGQSCASVARDEGIEFLTVVMGCKDSKGTDGLAFKDTMTLFRWVYNAFTYKTVVSKSQPVSRIPVDLAWRTDSVALVAGDSLEGMLRNDLDIDTLRYEIAFTEEKLVAPVEKGQECGTATIYDGEAVIGTIPLCAADTVAKSPLLALLNTIGNVLLSPAMLIVYVLLGALLISYIAMSVLHNRARRKNKRKRVKRYR